MASRLQWFDATRYESILYEIDDDRPYNQKVATITYDEASGKFAMRLLRVASYPLVLLAGEDKQVAMEQVIAELVIRRMNQD